MEDKELETIYDETKKKRVITFCKEIGTFHYEEEYFSEEPDERCWISKGRPVIGIYDSQMKARAEAQSNIEWLKNLIINFKNL